MTPVRLEPAASWPRVKHSATEPDCAPSGVRFNNNFSTNCNYTFLLHHLLVHLKRLCSKQFRSLVEKESTDSTMHDPDLMFANKNETRPMLNVC